MSIPFLNRVGSNEVLLLLRNLAMTLQAGVPIARALSLFAEEAKGNRKKLIQHLQRHIEQGHQLSEAMASSPRKFPAIVIELTRAGEVGGTLVESLENTVIHLRKIKDLKRKIKSAMMYPTFVLVAILGLGLSVGTLVLPELIPLFDSLDVELPATTKLLLWVAEFFSAYGWAFTGVVFVCVVTFFMMIQLDAVKPYWHRVVLRIPYIGSVVRQSSLAEFARTLSTLLASGVPITEALKTTAQATNNRVFRSAIQGALPVVESGHGFAEGIKMSKAVPGLTATLIDIGEETGTLVETLSYLAEYYEHEVDYAVKDLTTALEPILLIGIGIIVGGTVLAIITPIYDVTGSIR